MNAPERIPSPFFAAPLSQTRGLKGKTRAETLQAETAKRVHERWVKALVESLGIEELADQNASPEDYAEFINDHFLTACRGCGE